MPAIELENSRHVFRTTTGTFRRHSREVVALDDVSLEIDEGEMFGLAAVCYWGLNAIIGSSVASVLRWPSEPSYSRPIIPAKVRKNRGCRAS